MPRRILSDLLWYKNESMEHKLNGKVHLIYYGGIKGSSIGDIEKGTVFTLLKHMRFWKNYKRFAELTEVQHGLLTCPWFHMEMLIQLGYNI